MRLLLDQHLSRRLADRLADVFPDSAHTSTLRMETADDTAIWRRARADGYALVTKDSDFAALSLRFGRPPLLVWLKVGNCDVAALEALLRAHAERLLAADADPGASVVEIAG